MIKYIDNTSNYSIFYFNFIATNPEYTSISYASFNDYFYKKLSDGFCDLSGQGNLFRTYPKGIKLGLDYPEFHGREHIISVNWPNFLKDGDTATFDIFQNKMFAVSVHCRIGLKGHTWTIVYYSQDFLRIQSSGRL